MNKLCENCKGTGHVVIIYNSFGMDLLEQMYQIRVVHCQACNGFGYLAEPRGETIHESLERSLKENAEIWKKLEGAK